MSQEPKQRVHKSWTLIFELFQGIQTLADIDFVNWGGVGDLNQGIQ